MIVQKLSNQLGCLWRLTSLYSSGREQRDRTSPEGKATGGLTATEEPVVFEFQLALEFSMLLTSDGGMLACSGGVCHTQGYQT